MIHRLFARIGIGFIVAVALAACGAGESAQGSVRPGPAGSGAPTIVMNDDVFQPGVVQVPAGAPVTIEVRNNGKNNHNFTIESLGVSTGPMKTGDVMAVTFTPPAGMTQFHCTWHQGMVAQIQAV